MDIAEFLAGAIALPGLSGNERPVAEYMAEAFRPLCDDVTIDVRSNMIARKGMEGPRIIICAHQDEIGLMVTRIEEDGALRITRVGGVDPRILPGLEVWVQSAEGPLFGVIGAKPPHLLTASDRDKSIKLDQLYVDIGMPADQVRARVREGDLVCMAGPAQKLLDGRFAGKTLDDRMGAAVMLECARELALLNVRAQVQFVCTIEEEVGGNGAGTAAYPLAPDVAIAIDVTHGEGPGTGKYEAYPLDKVVMTIGPNVHPTVHKVMMDSAARVRVDCAESVCGGVTGTDGAETQIAHGGIPTALLEVPLRYMHTTVETLSLKTISEAGRLLAAFIQDISAGWEELVWY